MTTHSSLLPTNDSRGSPATPDEIERDIVIITTKRRYQLQQQFKRVVAEGRGVDMTSSNQISSEVTTTKPDLDIEVLEQNGNFSFSLDVDLPISVHYWMEKIWRGGYKNMQCKSLRFIVIYYI